ncbi:hypothetical protein GGI15_004494 [Coemansia interrupta]|uniref:Kinase n=1 Tax=Coemansia interrupta TaxID=1126814 RepID=A0A9W8H5X2_9FUNG|nr:hypothetical protein GGI15_004494 [Coemansia interrupta]
MFTSHTTSDIDLSKLADFEHQIAGHGGIQHTEDQSVLIKPLDPRENAFYKGIANNPSFKPFAPAYFGTICLDKSQLGHPATHLCIENLTKDFVAPCIADIKIGTRYYDLDATPEKKARAIKMASERTSSVFGYCFCGLGLPGKPFADHDWITKLDKESVVTDALVPLFQVAEDSVDKEYRQTTIQKLIERISEYRDVIQKSETRMFGNSLLIIYESDPDRVKAGIGRLVDAGIGRLVDVRTIDFAHSHWLPGEGPDEQYLFGLDNLIQALTDICN